MAEQVLRAVAEELWVIDHPFRALGAQMGTRTSILRLQDGSLWLLAPGPGLAELKADITALGPVKSLVAPNTMHHLFLKATQALFPQATIYGPPGLQAKQPELAYTLLDQAPWADEIRMQAMRGLSMVQETAFYHAPSRSLLLTDLVFNIRHSKDTWTRLFMALNGGYGKFGPTRLVRTFFKDRAALSDSLNKVLAWDFDRIVVAHGEVLETGGKQALIEAFARLDMPIGAAAPV